jgi:hypothetical protein
MGALVSKIGFTSVAGLEDRQGATLIETVHQATERFKNPD